MKNNPWANLQLPQDTVIVGESNKFKKKQKQSTIYLEDDEYKNDRQLRLLADLESKINSHKNKTQENQNQEQQENQTQKQPNNENSQQQAEHTLSINENKPEEAKQPKITNIFASLKESDEEQDFEESAQQKIKEKQDIQAPTKQESIQVIPQLQEIHPVPIQEDLSQKEINIEEIVKPVIKKPKKKPIKRVKSQQQKTQHIKKHKKQKSQNTLLVCIVISSIICGLIFLLSKY